MHIQHPVLVPGRVEFRGYQANLARIASKQDTLVVLPTGMGKTIVALLVVADALQNGSKRILMMAPTKPLVEQHTKFFADMLGPPWNTQVHLLTGNVRPAERARIYEGEGVLCATPQVISNDIVAGHLDPSTLDWIVFDEAHRAVGEYPYSFIGRKAVRHDVRRLGLTASPGHDLEKINEVRGHLGMHHVEIRTPQDSDVAEYVQTLDVEWETLPLPENLARVSRRLHDALSARTGQLKQSGHLRGGGRRPTRRALLEVAHRLQLLTKQPDVPSEIYQLLSVQAQAMKLLHAIELAETQGAAPFRAFYEQMREEVRTGRPSKATQRLLDDKQVTEAYQIATYDERENPKLGRTSVLVQEALEKDPDSRAIVFANYRDTVEHLAEELAKLDGVRPVVFVGQGKRKGRQGMTQKRQHEVLEAFRAGQTNCLVATSVAEEGLDIPATDLVVFYEPIPSEIRSIQRRGRTGRHGTGRVVVLMTKGTQDEAAHWIARRKEQEMVRQLQDLRRALEGPTVPDAQTRLPQAGPAPPTAHLERAPKITCDHREQAGGIVRSLHELGAELDVRELDIGDFVLSDRVAVERKEAADFVDSLIDGRLFEQLKALQTYPKPLLIIEGDGLFGHRNISPESLFGALATVTTDMGIPVLQTKDPAETARLLFATAKREQFRGGRGIAIRPGKATMDDAARQRFVLAGFPLVDEARADSLLAHFGTLAAVLGADEKALAEVDGIGPNIAKELRRILSLRYGATESFREGA